MASPNGGLTGAQIAACNTTVPAPSWNNNHGGATVYSAGQSGFDVIGNPAMLDVCCNAVQEGTFWKSPAQKAEQRTETDAQTRCRWTYCILQDEAAMGAFGKCYTAPYQHYYGLYGTFKSSDSGNGNSNSNDKSGNSDDNDDPKTTAAPGLPAPNTYNYKSTSTSKSSTSTSSTTTSTSTTSRNSTTTSTTTSGNSTRTSSTSSSSSDEAPSESSTAGASKDSAAAGALVPAVAMSKLGACTAALLALSMVLGGLV